MSTGWMRWPVRRTRRGSPLRPSRSFRQRSWFWNARPRAARVSTSAMRKRRILADICRKLDGVALGDRACGEARRIPRPAADRGAARPAPDAAVARLAHRAAAPEDVAGHARLELRAAVRRGTRGAAPARGVRRAFHARCGAGGRHQRDARSVGGVRRDRQPGRQVDAGDPARSGR